MNVDAFTVLFELRKLAERLPTEEEKELVRTVERTVLEYQEKINSVSRRIADTDTDTLDQLAVVDDSPAVIALARLQKINAERSVLQQANTDILFQAGIDSLMKGTAFAATLIIGAIFMIALILRAKRTNAEMQRAYEQVDQVYSDAPNAMISVDSGGNIIRSNRNAEDLLGYTNDELRALKVEDLIPKTLRHDHKNIREKFMKSPTYRPMLGSGMAIYAVRKDGHQLRVDIAISVLKSSQGNAFLLAIKDMSEIYALQDELSSAKIQAEAANVAKSRFLATMSHEIRTPLNGVLGVLQLINEKDITPDVAHKIKIAHESGLFLSTLINQVLDFSKIEAGEFIRQNERFSLSSMLDGMYSMFKTRVEMKGVRLETRFTGNSEQQLEGDCDHIRQILFNLIGNAVKFTNDGKISISAEVKDLNDGTARISFEIADTGPGIDPAEIGSIFDEFSQSDSGKRHGGGTGLGLSICKRLAETIEADLTVESTPGKGTTFYFALKARIVSGVQVDKDEISEEPDFRFRVLVAEDNDVNQLIVRSMLEKDGHDVTIVSDGRSALDLVKKDSGQFDLILMDIQMPIMDGVQAATAIRHIVSDGIKLPIVALTANAFVEQKNEYLAVGMQSVMTKPLAHRSLRLTLSDLAMRKQQNRVSREEPELVVNPPPNPATPCTDKFSSVPRYDNEIISDIGGSIPADRLEGMLRAARSEATTMMSRLKNADVNLEQKREVRHELKGMLANLGLNRSSKMASDLSHAALISNGTETEIVELEAEIIEAFEHLGDMVSKSKV